MAPGGIEFLPDMPDLVRIFLPDADLNKRPAMANVQTFRQAARACRQQLERLLARNSWRGWTEDWIRSVEYTSPNLTAAAAAANCSTRTLDRRLREEGTSFRKVVAEVRHQQAVEWLGDSHVRVSDVAARLGYNEVSNFSRAFRRAAGKSPRCARRRSSSRSTRDSSG
jgi:AraC-like DNA-binding protein